MKFASWIVFAVLSALACFNWHAVGQEKDKKTEAKKKPVRHNDVLVIDHFELKGAASQGNIFLQDHGNPVVYRNIWVVELK